MAIAELLPLPGCIIIRHVCLFLRSLVRDAHYDFSDSKSPISMKCGTDVYSVSQKIPLKFSDIFCPNDWEFLVQILQAYYTFLSTLDYKFLFNYLQL